MEKLTNSRFITYPSTVDKANNHTVILIDATTEELTRLERFLKISSIDFDVYLYQGELYDLEWLNYISKSADHILIKDSSQVSVTSSERYTTEPLDYFEKIEQLAIDNTEENLL
jgi:hypothetical protein